MNMRLVWVAVLAAAFWKTSAQLNPGHREAFARYADGKELFDKRHFDPAREIFTRLRATDDGFLLPDIDYYLTMIAVYEDHPLAGELIDGYLTRYYNSPYRDRIRLLAVDRAFASGRYKAARRMIDEIDMYNLPPEGRERLLFYNAYIALQEGDLSKAKRLFKELRDSKTFGTQARYYLGYIAYLKNNPAEAERYFSQVESHRAYARDIPYYRADMYYRAGDFRRALEEALKIYPRARGLRRSELAKIIGSAYFNLGEYEKAVPYLEAYRGKKGKWSHKDYYELGYAYYQTGRCDKAVDYFNKIIDGGDALAQNAYYHLAKCYLKQGDKTRALNAFKKVAEMEFDPRIREDAWYNYIKLSYEIGNPYEPLHDIIAEYLAAYPSTPHRNELKELLINSYITSRNYEAALRAMQESGMTDRPAFQKVAFLRGVERFNEGAYEDAIRYFDLSLKHGLDPAYRARATFWKAEALYRSGKYDQALTEYKSVENDLDKLSPLERNLYDYNVGYVYFKLKNYPQAAKYFARYVRGTPDPKLLKDAYLRLGDSYFASKKYWPAMEAYNKAIELKGHNADYAFYQKAVSYGFVGRTGRKIEELNKFLEKYPRSPLADDALYQLGSTYLNIGKFTDAVSAFDRLLQAYPDSPYVPAALLKKGLAYYNAGDNGRAKEIFKELIRRYPQTPEAVEAAEYLKNIYIDENDPDGFLTFINGIPGFNVETAELEQELYRAAETKYFEQNYPAARAAFAAYLKRFPEGVYRKDALYYLAKIHQKLGEPAQAYAYYARLAELPPHEHTAEALRFLALESLKQGKEDEARRWLERLRESAQTDDDRLLASSNLMHLYAREGDLARAAAYAREVLENPKHDKVMEIEAKKILAREAVSREDWDTAYRLYDELARKASGETAAEALYYKALILHRRGEYDASNKVVAELSKKYPSYKKWGGKALIVMARNMYAKGDVFNATYILENVIKKFDKYPEVTAEARELLEQIRREQSDENQDMQDENE